MCETGVVGPQHDVTGVARTAGAAVQQGWSKGPGAASWQEQRGPGGEASGGSSLGRRGSLSAHSPPAGPAGQVFGAGRGERWRAGLKPGFWR